MNFVFFSFWLHESTFLSTIRVRVSNKQPAIYEFILETILTIFRVIRIKITRDITRFLKTDHCCYYVINKMLLITCYQTNTQ